MFAKLWSETRYRARAIFRRAAVEQELNDEVQFHIAQETAKYERDGLSHADAVRKAHLAFGGVERIKDDTRDARGIERFDNLRRDIRLALHGMRTRPAFAAAVIIIIALGVGVNAAMFGVLDRTLFRDPKYLIDGGSVNRVYMSWIANNKPKTQRGVEYARYEDFRRWSRNISDIAAFQYSGAAIGDGENATEMPIAIVSASYFDFFKLQPVAGRLFDETDDNALGGQSVVVLGYDYWKSHYASTTGVVGSQLRIGATLHTIVGIAPEGFEGIADQRTPAVFLPLKPYAHNIDPNFANGYAWSWLQLVVRRKPGVSEEAANTDLTNAFRQSWNAQRETESGFALVDAAKPTALAGPLQLGRGPGAGPETKTVLWISGVALIVLLIAAANVANLLLARAFQRRQELAVRRAIGGSRARIAQQLLTETTLLVGIGGALGAVAALWSDGLMRTVFSDLRIAAGRVDARTVLFSLIITLVAAVLASLVPALYSGREDLTVSLRAGSRDGAYRRSRTRSMLLVVQVAMSVVLLVGAGLFVKSLSNVRNIRLGYDVDPIAVVDMNPRGIKLTGPESIALAERMVEVARATPGVINASRLVSMPFGSSEGRAFKVPGIDSLRKLGRFVLQAGSPQYFATAGTRILRGRAFQMFDDATAPRVAVVSEAMASVIWPGEDAIGKCMKFGKEPAPCTTVIGVAETVRKSSLSGADEFVYYLPVEQYGALFGAPSPSILVRVNGESGDYLQALRSRLQPLMPGTAYVRAWSFSDTMERQVKSWKFGATMFVALGSLALFLAAIGLYAVVAFGVAQRSHEMGVRIALGAHGRDLLRLVIGEGLRYIIAGVAVGSAVVALAGSRLQPVLFSVSSRDPFVYASVGIILVVVGAVACTLPATRALRVDPNAALRGE